MAGDLHRGEYFAGLFIFGFASGFTSRIVHSIEEIGWADALFRTFGISVIILASGIAGISLIMRDHTKRDSSFRARAWRLFHLAGHSPHWTLELDRRNRSKPLYPLLHRYRHLSAGCASSCWLAPSPYSGVACYFSFLLTTYWQPTHPSSVCCWALIGPGTLWNLPINLANS